MGSHHVAAVAVAWAFLGGGCASDTSTSTLEASEQDLGIVAGVADGDTLRLRDGRRVRLVQIDAPERAECFFRGSTRALERLAGVGARVELRRDRRLDNRDEHGRLLRYVYVDGVNVNVRLVADGAAAPYFFRGDRGAHADRLLASARAARRAGLGMWSACPSARLDPQRGALTGPG